jgi:ABC-type multidrug transport system fused ATPase/permease subunit
MEELKPDFIKNKNEEQIKQLTKSDLDENKDKKPEDKNLEKKESESDPNIIDQKKELEQIKLSHIKQYSFFELTKKSLSFSKKNLKLSLFNIFRKALSQFIDAKIPIIYGKLLNTIIKEKDYEKLVYEFKKHIFYLSMRIMVNYLGEIFGFFFVKNSAYQNKKFVLENIAQKDIEFFDLYRTGEIVDGIKKNENILDNNFIFKCAEFAIDIFNFFYLLLFLKNTSFNLMIFFFFVQLLKFGFDFILRTYMDFRNRKKKNDATNKYNSSLYEFISNIRLIKSMGLEDIYLEKLHDLKLKFFKTFCNFDDIIGPVFDFINKVLDISIVFFAGKYAIKGYIDYSDLTIFQNYSNQLKKKFHKIKQMYKQFLDIYYGWKRFFEYYEFEPKVLSEKNFIPEDSSNYKYNYEFKNVKFAYPTRPKSLVYKNLSFKIESGKSIAFVGYSGGGKSTLVNLLQRLYDPLEGEILLNDINLKDFDIKWLRQKIGCVPQEPVLLSGSIEENITIGLGDYDKERFKKVCKAANLDFIKDKSLFPHGFKTHVGERGGKLSGGQKQRIAIARALMRDIKILILDEATSALDSKNEKDLQMAIECITKKYNITTIIIAHRLSTVKNADEILFLDKGEIIEKGRHEELLEKEGEYFKLVKNQLIKTNLDL